MSNPVTCSLPSMGGTLTVAINADDGRRHEAAEACRRAANRVNAWARRLSRFEPESDLSQLNATASTHARVRPTLAATLQWAQIAHRRTDGVVDGTLLDARLAAETGAHAAAADARPWRLEPSGRSAVIRRASGVRFDVDGLAKGWLADRAAQLLWRWPGVAIDADGDIALTAAPGVEWRVAVSDPADDTTPLATLHLRGGDGWQRAYGVATSGTSVHRWRLSGIDTHHLIDPRTGVSAETDVVQATIVASSAREAEILAKGAVILGSHEALRFLEGTAALAAILLLDTGEVVALPGIERWLA